jgi:hydrogenase maturation protease
MSERKNKRLVIGIGNEGRGDDGLGWRFAEKAAVALGRKWDVEYRYQLQVEDAELVSNYDTVIFADATVENLKRGFDYQPCELSGEYFFSSHMQSPEAVLYLSGTLYKKKPEAFVMKICGHEWEMGVGLSLQAKINLEAALAYFRTLLIPARTESQTSK